MILDGLEGESYWISAPMIPSFYEAVCDILERRKK